jgi:FecR protein
MNTNDTRKPSLDEVLASIRGDEPSDAEVAASADRLRAKLGLSGEPAGSSIHIESCAGFQALIPAFLAGRLPRETALLLEDHSRECIPCRRALIAARTPKAVPAGTAGVPATRPSYTKWAAAAALAATVILGAYSAWRVLPILGADPQLKVMRVDGSLYQLNAGNLVPLRPGMKVSAKSAVRTAKDSGALVMMDDGSRIEMRDRTELTVAKRRDGSTVRLGGGAIIVEASPQGSGHLDVRTDDCLVAVKGTIFSVNTGTKGSRVSVVEGAVRVAADGRESLLKPGDQMTTSTAVTAVAVGDEIAWSKDAPRYAQLLHELAALRKDLDARVPLPGLRYNSKILDRMPDGTVLYAAIPNITDQLVTAKQVFEEHIAQSGALQAWWNEHMSGPEHRADMDAAFEKVKALGSQLGDEIVIALARSKDGTIRGPILMSEVKDRGAFRSTLAKDMKDIQGQRPDASMTFEGSIVQIEFKAHRAAATSPVAVAAAAPIVAWDTSPFRSKLAAAYQDGTSWLFGVDLEAMLAHAAEQARAKGEQGERMAQKWERMGVLDAQYLVFERKEDASGANLHAEISFDQPRRGLAGWLAAPSPMGAAEFVSPDAAFAAAAVVKRPELLLAEALSWIDGEAQLPPEADLDPLRGIAATLGGDVAIALDGPVLPVPSWKAIIEVYDPVQFQSEFTKLIGRINDRIAAEGHQPRIVLESEQIGNRTDWIVRFTGSEAETNTMRYTIADGYLIAAPSRALIDTAIEQRGNGYTLVRSTAFTALLPADGQVNVSAFVWEHLGPTIGPLAAKLGGVLDADELKSMEQMAGESHPRLVTVDAEGDRIIINTRGEAGLGAMFGSILSAHNFGAFGHALAAARQVGAKPPQ